MIENSTIRIIMKVIMVHLRLSESREVSTAFTTLTASPGSLSLEDDDLGSNQEFKVEQLTNLYFCSLQRVFLKYWNFFELQFLSIAVTLLITSSSSNHNIVTLDSRILWHAISYHIISYYIILNYLIIDIT